MFFAVFFSFVTLQVHALIITKRIGPSMGQVCPTRHFENPTPINKGRNKGHTLEISCFEPRTGKDGIKWNAVRLARHQLRDEGLSFVAVDDINPLEERVRPVIDSLNADGAENLEAALRALGADVPDQDRWELFRHANAWRERILLGDMNQRDAQSVLGKLSVALGVEGFNDFVEVYNHGVLGGSRVAD
jgi:hypothetical protein